MIRLIKMTLLVVLALAIVLLAIANRDSVVVELLPPQLSFLGSWSTSVPLFLVMIVMAGGGFVLGWSWEWFREMRMRGIAKQRRREITKLEREVKTLRQDTGREEDDVLALLK